MMYPADLVNRSLDALGIRETIGNVETDGTLTSEAARRIYGPTLRQLLRTANWSFARKRSPLQLLGDRTGQTPNVGTIVEDPWLYVYAWPIDGVRVRWLPWTGLPASALAPASFPPAPGQVSLPNAPILPVGSVNTGVFWRERPARFQLSTTDQYPAFAGPETWQNQFSDVEGQGPTNRRVILTNVQFACLVYTYLALEIEVWDELFAQAMVAVIASLLAMSLIEDKKLAIAERNAQIAIAKNAIREARVASHQEAGFPQSTDHMPDWLRVRRGGRGNWWIMGPGGGPGMDYCGWESFSFSDGSVM